MKRNSYRDTWAEILLDNIHHNFLQFRGYVKEQTKIMAVVKADGYGHGAVEIAKTLMQAEADYLAVALLDEALQLRNAGISHPILVLGYTPVRSVQKAVSEDITLTVFSHEVLDEIIIQSSLLQKTASVHLKVDTGMSRIGITSAEEALELAQKAATSPSVYLEGIFTHFANADSKDPAYTLMQFQHFLDVIESLETHDIHVPIRHCCNSAGTMNFPDMHLDMVRIGIALYGLYPNETFKGHSIKLKQAMNFKTKIAALKTIPASQRISYGWTYKLEKESLIATLPLGYADGLSRLLSNQGMVLMHEQLSPIVGRVCMDQTMIDVTDIDGCSTDDEVTIFGHNGSSFQSVDEIAKLMGTINYEVVCLIGKRVPRIYVKSQQHKLFVTKRVLC
ncbi:alanine racemase [Bacillus sp. AFS018417]|uniref:alanine racemase n=1 Tax=Bacillus sp. AFS018417 TaxID=2033491 RepID=UPI000BF92602|nr:alanine racemase [Bacillus sp. AFS018417]PEZ09216.1 alanine racemase [Bacillus sp. AFS018417]